MKTQESLSNNENNMDHRVRTEPTQSHPLFRPTPVSVDVVILTFKCLDETNTVGSDDIAYRFIKDSFPLIAFYITICVNTSISGYMQLYGNMH